MKTMQSFKVWRMASVAWFGWAIQLAGLCIAAEPTRLIEIWPGLAPGENAASTGDVLPRRNNENPPATRITRITQPQLEMFEPASARRTGASVLIFPGGGYNYVVVDKEGSEPAAWLNELGITAFVVRYRTKDDSGKPLWERPLQDGQRALSLVRSNAKVWNLDPNRIGVLGFSAGGQAAAVISTRFATRSYPPVDAADQLSCRPDFTMLVYPAWLIEPDSVQIANFLPFSGDVPPALLVHAHDDNVTPLSSVAYYTALKQQKINAELHIFAAGGHGFGTRPVAGTNIHTWTDRASDWLRQQVVH